MQMGRGKAFLLGTNSPQVEVNKQWLQLEGRQFLIEEVPVASLADELDTLPQATTQAGSKTTSHVVAKTLILPPQRLVKTIPKAMFMTKASVSAQGLVLDYQTINSSLTNYTFQGDTTYYISGTVNLYGTSTFEGGAVLKYAPTNSASVTCSGPINSSGSAYRPAIFTARDDNSVGETIAGSSGNPTNYYAAAALYLNGGTSVTMQNLRFSFAQTALVLNGSSNNIFSHVQMVNCQNGISATNATFCLRNALLWNVRTNFGGSGSTGAVEQLTVDTASRLNNNLTLSLTNCLLVAVTNAGTFASNSVSIVSTTNGIFQIVGAGAHYLATNSPYRNAGTANINPTLLSALQKMTTYPPVVYSNITISVATNFSPQAQRDTNTALTWAITMTRLIILPTM